MHLSNGTMYVFNYENKHAQWVDIDGSATIQRLHQEARRIFNFVDSSPQMMYISHGRQTPLDTSTALASALIESRREFIVPGHCAGKVVSIYLSL